MPSFLNGVNGMLDKYLIALDLDGTLLTDSKEIDPRTKQTLLKAMNEDILLLSLQGDHIGQV